MESSLGLPVKGEQRGGKGQLEGVMAKGNRETFDGDGYLCCLTGHKCQNLLNCTLYVQFIVCQLYCNKDVKKCFW